MLKMVAERIERPDCSHGFVFDGFPRTVTQAKYLGEMLKRQGFKQPFVIHMVIGNALLIRRLTGRRTCKVGGEIYNIYDRPPKVEGICDNDGGELVQRPDDREEVIRQRLHAYEKQTAPLVSYYRRLGTLHEVDASKSVAEVEQEICRPWQVCAERVEEMAIQLRSAAELEKMYRAGQAVHEVLNALRAQVKPGMSTMDLEEIAVRLIAKGPGKAAFKGYRGYPCVLCTSVNSEIVHGIPSPKRKLREGDIVSIDFGMEVDGYYRRFGGDRARGADPPGAAEAPGCDPRIAGPRD